MRSLIVEDSDSIAGSLRRSLMSLGHAVDLARSVDEAADMIAVAAYDLIVLDLNLDGPEDGLVLLKRLRASGSSVAVMILTARATIGDRVAGLDLGADDYLPKPFDLDEFEARIRALARRVNGRDSAVIQLGELCFDATDRRVTIAGAVLDLPARERALLQILVENSGKVLPKSRILDRLSSFDDDLSPNALDIYIHRLRKRLASSGCVLRTARGLGYMLDAE